MVCDVQHKAYTQRGVIRSAACHQGEDRPVFALMAGSRPDYATLSVGFMLDIADHLLAEYPEGQAMLPVSPFIDPGIVLSVLRERGLDWDGAATDPVIFAG